MITNALTGHAYPSAVAFGGVFVCGAAAIEMAFCALKDFWRKVHTQDAAQKELIARQLSANLGGAVLLGMCAFQVLPGAQLLGAGLFLCYALHSKMKESDYLTKKVVRKTVVISKAVIGGTLEAITQLISKLFKSVWNYLIYPVSNGIVQGVSAVLDVMLPRHPIWVAVAAMVMAVMFQSSILAFAVKLLSAI